MIARLLPLLLLGATLAACGGDAPKGPPPKFKFELTAQAIDPNEKALPGMPVELDGKTVGYTDREGRFEATLTGVPGTEVTFGIGESTGMVFDGERTVTERLVVKRGVDGRPTPNPLSIKAVAMSTKLDYLVWVSTTCGPPLSKGDCSGLSVTVEGKEVAKTDIHGRAHFSSSAPKNSEIKVKIDTPKHLDSDPPREYNPTDPIYELKLGKTAEVYLIEETFTLAEPTEESKAASKPTKVKKKTRRSSRRKPRIKRTKKRSSPSPFADLKTPKKKKTVKKSTPKKIKTKSKAKRRGNRIEIF